MMTFSAYRLTFRSPLHIGERGVGLAETRIHVPADTLFSALCSMWRELYGVEALRGDVLDWFTEDEGGSEPFFLSSAFPYVDGVRFFPKLLARLTSVTVQEGDDKAFKRVRFVSESIFAALVRGEALPFSKANCVNGQTVWVRDAEKEQLAAQMDETSDDIVLWKRDLVPRVTLDRLTSTMARRYAASLKPACACWAIRAWVGSGVQDAGYLPGITQGRKPCLTSKPLTASALLPHCARRIQPRCVALWLCFSCGDEGIMATTTYTLTCLTPVHVGTGVQYSKFDGAYQDRHWHVIALDKVLGKGVDANGLARAMHSRTCGWADWLGNQGMTPTEGTLYALPCPQDPLERLAVGLVWTYTLRGSQLVEKREQDGEYKAFAEWLTPNTTLRLALRLDDFLFTEAANHELRFRGAKAQAVQQLAHTCNVYARAIIMAEREFYATYSLDILRDLYAELDATLNALPDGVFLLNIGWGGGWEVKTIGDLLHKALGEDGFRQLRQRYRLGVAPRTNQLTLNAPFPKTRRMTYEGGAARWALGWVKVEPQAG